jgi:hypothetical protein
MMRLTEDQYEVIRPLLPVQRGNMRIANLDVMNAVLYVAENGLQMARAAGAVRQLAHDRHALAAVGGGGRSGSTVPSLARTSPDSHSRGVRRLGQHQRQGSPRRHGRSKKNGPQAIGKSRGGWNTKIHLVAANDRIALTFALSPGQAQDAPEGRKLLIRWQRRPDRVPMVMDRAYEGDQTRQLAVHPQALAARGRELVADALADHLALELRETEQNVEPQPAPAAVTGWSSALPRPCPPLRAQPMPSSSA